MKNIHVLPANVLTTIGKSSKGLYYHKDKHDTLSFEVNQHIYITSDEKIKEGDWMLRNNENPIKVTLDFFWDFGLSYYKIILTTNEELIKDGIQSIDNDFLEWFVKNSTCEYVDHFLYQDDRYVLGLGYKIIIPKE
jgi:hypothetical protein